MDRTIWKAVLKPTGIQELEFPVGAEFLCAHEQHEKICIWFRVNPDQKVTERRKIAIIGTGHPAPADGRYLGSAFLNGGLLVLHVFAWPS
jgi:hypothetical protein